MLSLILLSLMPKFCHIQMCGEAVRYRYLEGPPIYRSIQVLKAANSLSILIFSSSIPTFNIEQTIVASLYVISEAKA